MHMYFHVHVYTHTSSCTPTCTCTCTHTYIYQLVSPHSCVHNASSMCSNGVGNVTDVDGVEVLVVRLTLYKYLRHDTGAV